MKSLVTLILLIAIVYATLGQIHQGQADGNQNRPHQNQGFRSRRQVNQEAEDEVPEGRAANWTTCDITGPKLSCHDCTTRLICKDVGGLLVMCRNPYKPYCNNGICSPVPSLECA